MKSIQCTALSPASNVAPSCASRSLILDALVAHANANPTADAVTTRSADGVIVESVSYSQLLSLARAHAAVLLSTAGPGSTLVLSASNSPALLASLLGALISGFRVCLTSVSSSREELADLCGRVRADAIVSGRSESDLSTGVHTIPLPDLSTTQPPCSPTDLQAQLGSVLLQSSGTTSGSRIVHRTSNALDADARNVADACTLTSGDRLLMAIPMTHSYGLDMVLGALIAGARIDTIANSDPLALARCLTESTTVFPGVPVLFEMLSRINPSSAHRPRLAFSAGSILPDQVRHRFESTWNLRIGDLYGASELGTVTFNHPDSKAYAAGSVGLPLDGVSIRALDPLNPTRQLGAGEEGHIAIAADSMFCGYLDGDAPMLGGHWLTGDVGRLDGEGRLFLTGRTKCLIDIGGVKVNPMELEETLTSHPEVLECVIVPLQESPTITRLHAVFVPRNADQPPAPEALREFMRARVSGVKVPRVFEAVRSLPRSDTGKVLRQAIIEARG